MTSPANTAALDHLVTEISQRFGDVGRGRIVDCLERARRELAGSVSPEGLPEMAARLMIYRLEAMLQTSVA